MKNKIKKYLRFSIYELLISFFIYILGVLSGLIIISSNNVASSTLVSIIEPFNPLPIITNNLLASLYLSLGIILLGIPTILLLFYNGMILGGSVVVGLEKYTLLEQVLRIIPHGIFEIPGMLFAAASGFQIIVIIILALQGKEINKLFYVKKFCFLLIMATIFIIISGFIEAYITPILF